MENWPAKNIIFPGFKPRPQHHICDKTGIMETVTSTDNALFVFIKNVSDSEITIDGKVGKVTIESSNGLKLNIRDHVVGGVLEFICCQNSVLNFGENAEIPTIQVDDSGDVNVKIQAKAQLECIYFIRTKSLRLFLENQTVENESGLTLEYEVSSAEGNVQFQQIGHWSNALPDAAFITEAVVREGVYPTTAEMKKAAENREETALVRMADMLVDGIKINRPDQEKTESGDNDKVIPKNPNPYGRHTEDEKKEFFEDDNSFALKLNQLCDWIKESQHCIIFTGAGISTSTGIPDYRSGMDTVLKTGPGVWELRDKKVESNKSVAKSKQVLKAVPSPTHMAIVKLHQCGIVKFVVSQNVDGLHLRSGLDPSALAELHGNTNLETCVQCEKKYLRDFPTRNASHVRDHETGRLCTDSKCHGNLIDSIVNFGEPLPQYDLDQAFSHANLADLCICMGSSLTVSPANDIPEIVAYRKKRLVICNLQQTPLHDQASMVIHAMCDDVMRSLMSRLETPLQKWKLRRRIRISFLPTSNGVEFRIVGLDLGRDLPYSLFTTVMLSGKCFKDPIILTKEPFTTVLPYSCVDSVLYMEMAFHRHYSEPNALHAVKIQEGSGKKDLLFSYDLQQQLWDVEDI